jgi:hypothetical protein
MSKRVSGPRDVKVHLSDRLRVCLRWKTGSAWIHTCGPRDYEKTYPNEMAVFLRVFSLLRPVCKQVCKRVYVLRV